MHEDFQKYGLRVELYILTIYGNISKAYSLVPRPHPVFHRLQYRYIYQNCPVFNTISVNCSFQMDRVSHFCRTTEGSGLRGNSAADVDGSFSCKSYSIDITLPVYFQHATALYGCPPPPKPLSVKTSIHIDKLILMLAGLWVR